MNKAVSKYLKLKISCFSTSDKCIKFIIVNFHIFEDKRGTSITKDASSISENLKQ